MKELTAHLMAEPADFLRIYAQTSWSEASLRRESDHWKLTVADPKAGDCFLVQRSHVRLESWSIHMVNGECTTIIHAIQGLTFCPKDPTFNMSFDSVSGKLTFASGEELYPWAWHYCNAISQNLTWVEYWKQFENWLTLTPESLSAIGSSAQIELANSVGAKLRDNDAHHRDVHIYMAKRVAEPIGFLLNKDDHQNPLQALVKSPATRFQGEQMLTPLHEAFAILAEADPGIKLPDKHLEIRK